MKRWSTAGAFTLVLSPHLFAEIEDVVRRDYIARRAAEETELLLDRLRTTAEWHRDAEPADVVIRDP